VAAAAAARGGARRGRGSVRAALAGGAVPVAAALAAAPLAPAARHLASSIASAAGPAERIGALLAEHDVVIFSKTTCPFCARTKQVLGATGAEFHVMELNELPEGEGAAFQEALFGMTGARTVPRIFVKGQCIGGCDDLLALESSGKLQEMLPGAGAGGAPATDFKLQRSDEEWRKLLGPKKFNLLRQSGTEAPGSSEYDSFMPEAGHFACGACSLPLYSADSKFRSSCGWPVFDKCYSSKEAGGCHVGAQTDFPGSVEIVCNRCSSHLGHVFFDAFTASNPNGERH